MAQGRKITLDPIKDGTTGPVERAVAVHDWDEARYQSALKLARSIDQSDSARDVKAGVHELAALLISLEADDQKRVAEGSGTPLAQILNMAQR